MQTQTHDNQHGQCGLGGGWAQSAAASSAYCIFTKECINYLYTSCMIQITAFASMGVLKGDSDAFVCRDSFRSVFRNTTKAFGFQIGSQQKTLQQCPQARGAVFL